MNGFVLHLQGPIMSFGDTGFGQLRDAGAFPSRSAVIGVLAAALGVERGGGMLLDLHARLRIHIATVAAGSLSVDYHTVKPSDYAEDEARYFRYTPSDVNAVQTWRNYHNDAHFVALIEGDDSLLGQCSSALADPVYVTFLGRRSCPPAMPLLPRPAEGNDIREVLTNACLNGMEMRWKGSKGRVRQENFTVAYLDGDYREVSGRQMHSTRRDLLTALPRSYVSRPVTHVRLDLPGRAVSSPPPVITNEEVFDALP